MQTIEQSAHPGVDWAWLRDRVLRHADGVAVGSTVAALAERGVLEFLLRSRQATLGDIRERFGGNPGYLQVALRLLADQGWAVGGGASGTDEFCIEVTRAGQAALGLAAHYQTAAALLPVASTLGELLSAGAGDADAAAVSLTTATELMRREWDVPGDVAPARARLQVLHHLDGHLVAPVMALLLRHGALGAADDPDSAAVSVDPIPAALRRSLLEVVARQRWVVEREGGWQLTAEGVAAAVCARQYWYPISYLPMLRQVPQLLFGDPGAVWTRLADEERHVDRGLDIRFSGEVFAAHCREPFLQTSLPVFDQMPLAAQPSCVIDTGCGDGRVLEALYGEVRDHTSRGRELDRYPLLMVGVEPSAVARESTARRLAAAGIPHLVIDGSISDPGDIAQRLRAVGVDAADALHVSKSVLHNRPFETPELTAYVEGLAAAADFPGAFARPDGRAIPPREVVANLAELLRRWRPLAARHGMVVIEAHSVDPSVTARLHGHTSNTVFDATHGYSNQYPIEPDAFSWAIRASGFSRHRHREPAAAAIGHTLLTVDYLTTDRVSQPY